MEVNVTLTQVQQARGIVGTLGVAEQELAEISGTRGGPSLMMFLMLESSP